MNDQPNQQPSVVAAAFVGPIMHPWTQCLRNVLCGFATQRVKTVILLLSSHGGSVFEGISLYNLIRTLPFELHTQNIGTVQSIANIVFLAGAKRYATVHSNFLLHNFTWTFAQETLTEPQVHEKVISLESARTDFMGIFKEHTNIGPEVFDSEKYFERPKILSPSEALKAGMIHGVGDDKLPEATPVFNVIQGP